MLVFNFNHLIIHIELTLLFLFINVTATCILSLLAVKEEFNGFSLAGNISPMIAYRCI